MSNASQESWYDNPNAPKIPSQQYLDEKANFAGIQICAVFYGVVIALFFRCMSVLLKPMYSTRSSIKWLLVAHTATMFLFVTLFTAINLHILSISYIDNRQSHGGTEPVGPLGYQYISFSSKIGIVSTVMFLLNNLLADGLLLYRCYVTYSMNPWIILFPCLLYLAAVGMGIALVYYQISQPTCKIWRDATINIGIPYSISVSLDVLLTLMIIARIVLLSKEVRSSLNAPSRISRVYKMTIAILSESSALYAITFLLWIGAWAANDPAEYAFFPLLSQTQVIAPFLIILRVADQRKARTETSSSIPLSIGESTVSGWTPSGGRSAISMGLYGKKPVEIELDVRTTTTIELHRDKI